MSSPFLSMPRRSALFLLALVLMNSGCRIPSLSSVSSRLSRFLPSAPPVAKLKEPPYIPLAPTPGIDPSALSVARQNRDAGFYSDLPPPSTVPNRTAPPLREALIQAILFRILKPGGPQDRFMPNRGVTYGEVRRWILAYQQILVSAMPRSPIAEEAETSADALDRNPSYAPPFQASNIPLPTGAPPPTLGRVVPSEMLWGDHRLPESAIPTREELYALYVFLTGQENALQGMTPDSLESVISSDGETGLDDALGQVKDYEAISPWARPYVAIAYRDRIPQAVFGLTPARLTLNEGLSPQKTVTRGEVILLLYRLYGPGLSRLDPYNLLLRGPQLAESNSKADKNKDLKDPSGKSGKEDKNTAPGNGKILPSEQSGKAKQDSLGKPIPLSLPPGEPGSPSLDALRRLQETTTSTKPERGKHAEEIRQILRVDAPE